MKKEIIKDWITEEGYRCVIRFNVLIGFRNGFIFIPYSDPAYIDDNLESYKGYDVHGGFAYQSAVNLVKDDDYPVKETRHGIWLGFDCGHITDKPDYDYWRSIAENENDINIIEKMFESERVIQKMNKNKKLKVWTTEDVVKELESLSKQFSEANKDEQKKQK